MVALWRKPGGRPDFRFGLFERASARSYLYAAYDLYAAYEKNERGFPCRGSTDRRIKKPISGKPRIGS
jgi:hypothetical protein